MSMASTRSHPGHSQVSRQSFCFMVCNCSVLRHNTGTWLIFILLVCAFFSDVCMGHFSLGSCFGPCLTISILIFSFLCYSYIGILFHTSTWYIKYKILGLCIL